MAEVFISYSRKDKEFVRRLGDGLVAHQREAWVDWKDIPLTSEWQQEILSNIEAADNFIFVISPSSVASLNCRKEIDHAAANHKKMLPLLYLPVADEDVPETLGRFQRLDFSDPESFEARLDLLIAAMDADLPWIQAHTRLLTRAKEWERSANDNSFLLRGKDLREGEQWLARSSDQEPKPTTLQSQYILASRQGATRTQRIIFGAVAAALLVAVGLAIYAFHQRAAADASAITAGQERDAADKSAEAERKAAKAEREAKELAQKNAEEATRQKNVAQEETAKAIQQAKIANGRRLATEASSPPAGKVVARPGGIVALESLLSYPTVEAMGVLSGELRYLSLPPVTYANSGQHSVDALVLSRDGRWMASGGDGKVVVWDVLGGMKPSTLLSGDLQTIRAMAFSDDGRWLAAGTSVNAVYVWEVGSSHEAVVLSHGYPVRGVTFSPDGEYLATSTIGEGPDRGVRVFKRSSENWEDLKQFPQGKGWIIGIQFVKTGELAVADETGVWMSRPSASPSNPKVTLTDSGACTGLTLSSDKSTLAAECKMGIALARMKEGTYQFEGPRIEAPINSGGVEAGLHMALSGKGDFLSNEGSVYRLGEYEITRELVLGSKALAFQPGRNVAAGSSHEGSISFWPILQGNQAVRIPGLTSVVYGVDVHPNGHSLATVDVSGELRIFDINGPDRIRPRNAAKLGNNLMNVNFSPNGQLLAIASKEHVFLVQERELRKIADWSAAGISVTAFTKDGRTLIVHDRDGLRLMDTLSGKQRVAPLAGTYKEFRLSPDEIYLGAFSDVNYKGNHHSVETRRVWRMADGVELAWEEKGREPNDGPATRAPQGGPQTLVKASASWPDPFERKHNSPDGVWHVAWSEVSSTLDLQESAGKRSIATLDHDGEVTDAVFDSQSRWLASSSKDGSVKLWPLKVDDVVAQACKLLPRNLTPQEWSELKMDGPYRKTCPGLP